MFGEISIEYKIFDQQHSRSQCCKAFVDFATLTLTTSRTQQCMLLPVLSISSFLSEVFVNYPTLHLFPEYISLLEYDLVFLTNLLLCISSCRILSYKCHYSYSIDIIRHDTSDIYIYRSIYI